MSADTPCGAPYTAACGARCSDCGATLEPLLRGAFLSGYARGTDDDAATGWGASSGWETRAEEAWQEERATLVTAEPDARSAPVLVIDPPFPLPPGSELQIVDAEATSPAEPVQDLHTLPTPPAEATVGEAARDAVIEAARAFRDAWLRYVLIPADREGLAASAVAMWAARTALVNACAAYDRAPSQASEPPICGCEECRDQSKPDTPEPWPADATVGEAAPSSEDYARWLRAAMIANGLGDLPLHQIDPFDPRMIASVSAALAGQGDKA